MHGHAYIVVVEACAVTVVVVFAEEAGPEEGPRAGGAWADGR
jgi:hypothetical protein